MRARERERERERERGEGRGEGVKVARACETVSARLSLQATRLSYFKTAILPPAEKYNVASILLLIKLSVLFVRCAVSDICAIMCVCVSL